MAACNGSRSSSAADNLSRKLFSKNWRDAGFIVCKRRYRVVRSVYFSPLSPESQICCCQDGLYVSFPVSQKNGVFTFQSTLPDH